MKTKYHSKPIKVSTPHNGSRTETIERYWDKRRKVWVNKTTFTY